MSPLSFLTVDDVCQIIPNQKMSETGCLSVFEQEKEISHQIQRIFVVSSTKADAQRGKHAHKQCQQSLICISGSCTVTCDDGESRKSYSLSSKTSGIYIPPSIWAEQCYHTSDTVVLVMCDLLYDEEDYLRCYDQFLNYRSMLKKEVMRIML